METIPCAFAFYLQAIVRSDLYSLGATAYHLVAGQPPFRGTTGVAVALAHAKEPLGPLAHVRPDFPVAVADVIERLLEKDQGKRFQSSSELLDAVEPGRKKGKPSILDFLLAPKPKEGREGARA